MSVNPAAEVRIGAAIRARRTAVRMTQARLAQALGVTFQQVQKYERGVNRVAATTLVRIAETLHCDVADLLELAPTETPSGSARLLRAWSRLGPCQRQSVTAMLEALAEPEAGEA